MFDPDGSTEHDERCCCPDCSPLCQDDVEFLRGTGIYATYQLREVQPGSLVDIGDYADGGTFEVLPYEFLGSTIELRCTETDDVQAVPCQMPCTIVKGDVYKAYHKQ